MVRDVVGGTKKEVGGCEPIGQIVVFTHEEQRCIAEVSVVDVALARGGLKRGRARSLPVE